MMMMMMTTYSSMLFYDPQNHHLTSHVHPFPKVYTVNLFQRWSHLRQADEAYLTRLAWKSNIGMSTSQRCFRPEDITLG